MKKLYIDMSCDKVNGQQHMQRCLMNKCKEMNIYSEAEDADILCYVQVKPDENLVNDWRRWKAQGKKIVFIHHYMSKSFYERCNIFKLPGLLEELDYQIIISKESELYDYLINGRNCDPAKIAAYEQAGSEYNVLREKYFKFFPEKIEKSIMFCGKAVKGIDKFVEFTKNMSDWKRIILCPDPEKAKSDLSNYEVYNNKTFDSVYEVMSNTQFIYVPTSYKAPPMHVETVVQEAIPCGTLVVVDEDFVDIIKSDDFQDKGFVMKSALKYLTDKDCRTRQRRAKSFQETYFLTLSDILKKNIETLQSI